jgi:hypothetical protein
VVENNRYLVGLLGILNGLFGKQEDERGYLSAEFNSETGELVSFSVTPSVSSTTRKKKKT